MIRRPPRSTLFPYTTLFRSLEPRQLAFVDEGGKLVETPGTYTISIGSEQPEAGHADRKSTRLNSSHLVISYAVFCLKKKKRTSQLTTRHRTASTCSLPSTSS